MREKVFSIGITRKYAYMYYLDADGDISCFKNNHPYRSRSGGVPMSERKKVACIGLKRESGFMYFVDKDGDVSRSNMDRRKVKV